ncbi:hypothetical protein K490DRAFT_37986, partial [Saccharata proteae CBS 121410]
CIKCHARKIKCSGGRPCRNCQSNDCIDECVYPSRDRQVKVSQNYIDELLQENQRLRERSRSFTPANHSQTPNPTLVTESAGVGADNEDPSRNPLLEDRPWFHPLQTSEMPFHINEAADAAFATRVRQALSDGPHNHIPRCHYVTDETLMSLTDMDCPWPPPARARFLVKAAVKYISQNYHIFRTSAVLDGLEIAVRNPAACDRLFIFKLWALFALGEVYSTKAASSKGGFPGLAYFTRASAILRILSERPRIEAIETILLLSLYSFALDRKHAGYWLASSAVRMSIVMGLHVNIPESLLNDRGTREHRNRVWWTAYYFERMWASKLGEPASVHDDDIEVNLPSPLGLDEYPKGDFGDHLYLITRLRLARLAGHIIAFIYGRRMQKGAFSQRVQQTLRDLRSWVQELPEELQLEKGEASQATPNHVVSLHLCFNQLVMLATRPVLLRVLRIYKESSKTPSAEPVAPLSETALALAEACIRCARHSYRLLTDCWIDGWFATFDYFKAHYLFTAAIILAISSLMKGKDSQNDGDYFETAAQFLDQLDQNGNFGAKDICPHMEAMRDILKSNPCRNERASSDSFTANPPIPVSALPNAMQDVGFFYSPGSMVTAGMALAEPSLQEFLAQPNLDLDLGETPLYDDALQGLYWPDLRDHGWMA